MYSVSNGIYLLTISMFFITCLNLIWVNFDVLQPSFIFNAMMSISAFFSMLNVERWNLFVSLDTCLVVLMGIVAFLGGAMYVHFINLSRIKRPCIKFKPVLDNISKYKLLMASVIMLILLMFSIQEAYSLSLQVGNQDGLVNVVKSIRYPLEQNQIHFSRWMNYRLYIASAITYVDIYFFMNILLYKKRIDIGDILYLIPVFCYIPFSVLTTGRYDILRLAIYVLIVFSVLYLKMHQYCLKYKEKIIIYFIITGFVILALFFLYGNFTGKTMSDTRTPFIIISHYVGLSIPSLDVFLHKQIFIENQYFAQNTFYGFYMNLKSLGLNVELGQEFLEFTYFNGIDGNVYTLLRREIIDFGYLGTVFLLFIYGNVYTFIYEYIKFQSNNPILLMIYAMWAYIPFLLFHDDIFRYLFGTQIIYLLILTSLVYKLFLLSNSSFVKNIKVLRKDN